MAVYYGGEGFAASCRIDGRPGEFMRMALRYIGLAQFLKIFLCASTEIIKSHFVHSLVLLFSILPPDTSVAIFVVEQSTCACISIGWLQFCDSSKAHLRLSAVPRPLLGLKKKIESLFSAFLPVAALGPHFFYNFSIVILQSLKF